MINDRDRMKDEGQPTIEDAMASLREATRLFEQLHHEIQESLAEGRDLSPGILAEEEAARARLFVARVQLSRRLRAAGT